MAASEPKGEDQRSHTSERQSSSASENGDPPLCKSKLDPESQIPQGAINSDSESGDVGRQIELEAGNSIKYRTCSWQKVRIFRDGHIDTKRESLELIDPIDCGTAVFRIYLSRHDVVPVVVFHIGLGAGADFDRLCRGGGALHLPDHLVRRSPWSGSSEIQY